jgi:hypothetical protein
MGLLLHFGISSESQYGCQIERTYALVVCDADDSIEKFAFRQVRSTRKEVADSGYGSGIVAVWLATQRASSIICTQYEGSRSILHSLGR